MQLRYTKIGKETFSLTFADADEVEALRRIDPQAALVLARRRNHPNMADGSVLHVPLYLADALPPELARMAAFLEGKTMTDSTTTVRIGDSDIAVDARVAAELGRLRAQLHDAYGASAGAALNADIAARRAPGTPRGDYIKWLENAHRNPVVGPHG